MKPQKFSSAIRDTVFELAGIRTASDAEAHEEFLKLPKRRNIWLTVSSYYNCMASEAHDYFHGVWSRQFYDDFEELKEAFASVVAQKHAEKLGVQEIVGHLIKLRPDKNFHKLSLNQFVHHQVYKLAKKQKPAKEAQVTPKLSNVTNSAIANSNLTVDDVLGFFERVGKK
ncbi:Conserved_hypothetical protein [Hexamita inflata]|uniref:Uncharacterized protein n=1 Tax=Hexamita inflata TaxID=28002 RepID=A0ABP1JRY9_9EUKA